jgi:hypothetical protein
VLTYGVRSSTSQQAAASCSSSSIVVGKHQQRMQASSGCIVLVPVNGSNWLTTWQAQHPLHGAAFQNLATHSNHPTTYTQTPDILYSCQQTQPQQFINGSHPATHAQQQSSFLQVVAALALAPALPAAGTAHQLHPYTVLPCSTSCQLYYCL